MAKTSMNLENTKSKKPDPTNIIDGKASYNSSNVARTLGNRDWVDTRDDDEASYVTMVVKSAIKETFKRRPKQTMAASGKISDDALSLFLALSGSTNPSVARQYLEMSENNLERAVNLFMDHGGGGADFHGRNDSALLQEHHGRNDLQRIKPQLEPEGAYSPTPNNRHGGLLHRSSGVESPSVAAVTQARSTGLMNPIALEANAAAEGVKGRPSNVAGQDLGVRADRPAGSTGLMNLIALEAVDKAKLMQKRRCNAAEQDLEARGDRPSCSTGLMARIALEADAKAKLVQKHHSNAAGQNLEKSVKTVLLVLLGVLLAAWLLSYFEVREDYPAGSTGRIACIAMEAVAKVLDGYVVWFEYG